MSLIKRKARPLKRDGDGLRDDRLFLVACDDTHAPKQYFDFFSVTRVKVVVVPTEDGTSSARHVLDRLLEFNKRDFEKDDEFWMLLDTDHCMKGTHLASFTQAIAEAQRKGIYVALSKPCFEFWLLLHHTEAPPLIGLTNAGEVEDLLRKTLGQYNKSHLLKEHYPLTSVADACVRSENHDATVGGGDLPIGNTSRVHLLWKAIASKALPSQLPNELRGLVK